MTTAPSRTSVRVEMPAGSFLIGAPAIDPAEVNEKPPHTLAITKLTAARLTDVATL
jgi:hypothetical protein